MSRIKSLGTNPTLRTFAKDASQTAIRPIAQFLAPSVEVPTLTGQYKEYSAKHRYKPPITKRSADGKATRIGFNADDAYYTLQPNALDFPIPEAATLNDEGLLNHAMYGAQLLADAAGLAHEKAVIDTAIAAIGAGTDKNFASSETDPIKELDEAIMTVMKAAKNGAPVKVLFGATAFLRLKNNANVRKMFVSGGGSKFATPGLADIQAMLFGNPECRMSLMVIDTAAEGVQESINFLLDEAILIFASKDEPNTMDPSFMKTFRLMGNWMVPGSYESEDKRDTVLKFDWYEQIKVTNQPAAVRINAKATS